MFEISSGKMQKPLKLVIYGPEGIGKSSFAAQAPGALFIDTEGSTVHMDVRRLPAPQSWTMLLQEVDYVRRTPGICKTLVIDTVDWAERMARDHVCSTHSVKGLEDFGYGKGYVYLYEAIGQLLNQLTEVINAGINVILTAHAKMRKFEQPDELGAYDRWEMKLMKETPGMVKEWADIVLFATYETYIVKEPGKEKSSKGKAQGGKRVMYTSHHPCWDAKNRHGLPDKLPLDFGQIAQLFMSSTSATLSPAPEPAPASASEEPKASPNDEDVPFYISGEPAEPESGIPSDLQQLMDAAGVTEQQISDAVAARGYYPARMRIRDYDPDFVQGCNILPAVRTLLAWLAKLTAVVSVFINSLFGKTASQADASAKALYNQASATEAAGDAAEKAKKQLSGLDEMNRWESNDSSGGGGGGSSGIAPKFDLSDQVDTGKIGKIAAVVRELSPYVAAVAAGFAAWKIGKKFLGNLSKAKQLALAVAGAVLMGINVVDMLKNGINFDNLTGYIIGAAAAVTGLGLAFGVLGGAITAIVAGLVLLGVAIRDVTKNGFNNKNLTAITVALLTIGGAIAIITGAWIPLLIAAMAAAVVWIVAKWTSIKDWFSGLWEKVASGAVAAWDGIKSAFKSVPEWFQSKFRDAWQKVKDVFSTGGRIWSGIKEGIENTFRAVVNAIIRGMNAIIAVPFNKINSMLNAIRNASFLGISPFQNMWGVNPLPVPQIPMLARGAVIPANRRFLAVLGDQHNGNNLEAPESLLRQIVREEAGGAGSRYEFIARLDRRTLFDEVITEAKLRKGQTGKNPLVAV